MPWRQHWAKSNTALVIIWTSIFLLHALVYLALIPPWQAPDEPTSFELLLTMEARNGFVNAGDAIPEVQRQIVESMQRNRFWDFGGYGRRLQPDQAPTFYNVWHYPSTQLNTPPVYQLLLLPLAKLTTNWSIEARLRLMRLMTILIAAIAVAVIAQIACELADVHPAIPWMLPAFVCLSPQFAYMSATVNSGMLGALIGALIFWRLLRVLRDGLSVPLLLQLGLLAAVGFGTKRTTLLILPGVIFGLLWQLKVMHPRHSKRRALKIRLAASALALLFLVIAIVPAIRASASNLVLQYVFKGVPPMQQLTVIKQVSEQHMSIWQWLIRSVKRLSVTFWGNFGWTEVHIPTVLAYLLTLLLIVSCLSALIWLLRSSRAVQPWVIRLGWVAIVEVLGTMVLLIMGSSPDFPPQGRYLFPALAPIFLLTTLGICARVPRQWAIGSTGILVCGLLALDLYSIVGVVVPAYLR